MQLRYNFICSDTLVNSMQDNKVMNNRRSEIAIEKRKIIKASLKKCIFQGLELLFIGTPILGNTFQWIL